jgi:hypothetical protein
MLDAVVKRAARLSFWNLKRFLESPVYIIDTPGDIGSSLGGKKSDGYNPPRSASQSGWPSP